MVRPALVLLFMAVVLCVSPSFAQPAPEGGEPVAEATRLFEEAKALMGRGEHERACGLFEESFALVRGIGVQYNLARCYATIGRTASALRHYGEVADVAQRTRQSERAEVARQRIVELEPRLIRLQIRVSEQTDELVVSLDGAPLASDELGSALPVDPGTHTVAAVAPERQGWSTEVDASVEGTTIQVVVPVLEQVTVGSGQPARDEGFWTGQAIGGLVIGAVGIVTMGVAVGVAFAAKSKDDEAATHCDAAGCDPQGIELNGDALRLGDMATGVFIAGSVLVGAGVVLLATSPLTSGGGEDEASAWVLTPSVGPEGGGALLRGRF